MKHWFAICVLTGLLVSAVSAQTTSGTITANETWSGTVTITGDLEISNAVVTIQPGTRVQFAVGQPLASVITGSEERIKLILRAGAGIIAVGTEAQPIIFTTASATPTSGLWGEIDLAGALDLTNTHFKHCIFEYGDNAFDFRSGESSTDWASIELKNPITIEYCTIQHMSGSGIYITSGGEPTISHCTIHDIVSGGIFVHGAQTVHIEYCTIYDVSTGIISPGESWWASAQKVYSVNNTIYDVKISKAEPGAQWWPGYGIWCGNTVGTLYLQNTIISNTDNAGLNLGTWRISKKNNCYYATGYESIYGGGSIHSESIEADPLFTNVATGDLSLQTTSPCIGAGSDGTSMGAWQPVISISDNALSAASSLLGAHPIVAGVSFTLSFSSVEAGSVVELYTFEGVLLQSLRTVSDEGEVQFAPVAEPGVYIVALGGQVVQLVVK